MTTLYELYAPYSTQIIASYWANNKDEAWRKLYSDRLYIPIIVGTFEPIKEFFHDTRLGDAQFEDATVGDLESISPQVFYATISFLLSVRFIDMSTNEEDLNERSRLERRHILIHRENEAILNSTTRITPKQLAHVLKNNDILYYIDEQLEW